LKSSTKNDKKIFVPCVSVSPQKLSFYSRPIDGFNYTKSHVSNWLNLEDNDHNGKISIKANRKIEMALSWLLWISNPKKVSDLKTGKQFSFKLNFITLTLPATQMHPDNVIKEVCLNNFLQVCRKNGLQNYLWRAEAQPSTGNIHFHIVTDMYIHYDSIRKWWNQSVDLLGYIEEFQLKFKHRNPNSTDVHSVKHIRNLANYLSKYLGKNRAFPCVGELRKIEGKVVEVLYSGEQYRSEAPNKKKGKIIGHVLGARVRAINGRLWGCSSSLSKLKTVRFDGELYNIEPFFTFVQQHDFKKFSSQYVDTYFGDVKAFSEIWFPDLFRIMNNEVEFK